MNPDYLTKIKFAAARKAAYRKLVNKLRSMKSPAVDEIFCEAHEKAFACIDCLKCANCCRTTGPLLTNRDISNLAAALKMKEGGFTQKYLRMDEDGDYVFQSMPCPFLGSDNYCAVYENRPSACRDYPHTDRSKQLQILHLALKNAEICPAVADVFKMVSEDKRVS